MPSQFTGRTRRSTATTNSLAPAENRVPNGPMASIGIPAPRLFRRRCSRCLASRSTLRSRRLAARLVVVDDVLPLIDNLEGRLELLVIRVLEGFADVHVL